MNQKTQRLSVIRKIIRSEYISSQEELIARLLESGMQVTQSCLIAMISCDRPDDSPVQPSPPAEKPEEKPSEKPEEKPEEKPVATKDNTYVIDGTEYAFGSVAVTNFGEYLCIAASPAENVENFTFTIYFTLFSNASPSAG